MRIFVNEQAALDELMEILVEEGVTFERRVRGSLREMNTGSAEMYVIDANLPEIEVPLPMREGSDQRAFRLPKSGRLLLTDLEGAYDRVATRPPAY
jgi:hypothetical protein